MLISEITPAMVVAGADRFSQCQADAGYVYWCRRRGKQQQIVRIREGCDTVQAVTPGTFCVRSRVNEYGGGDYRVQAGQCVFVADEDQCVYWQPDVMQQNVHCLTIEGPKKRAWRYTDMVITPDQKAVVCVRECHTAGVVTHDLVRMSLVNERQAPVVIAKGADFYVAPCFSPDGKQLAWITWSEQQMPWELTTLYCAEWDGQSCHSIREICPHIKASINQPTWSPTGELHVSSDHTGFWQIYRVQNDSFMPVAVLPGECGYPAWIYGIQTFAFAADGRLYAIAGSPGNQHMYVIEGSHAEKINLTMTDFDVSIAVSEQQVHCFAGDAKQVLSLVSVEQSGHHFMQSIPSAKPAVDHAHLVAPETVSIDRNGLTVSGFLYCPIGCSTPPPMIVNCHGGPTAHADTLCRLSTQYWVARGYAVLDVNYRGSSGYGREFRQALAGNWGEMDTEDCVAMAKTVASQGLADKTRCFIRGSSAGGLTVLNALIHHDFFAGGVSLYGVVDLLSLGEQTHRFEASYLNTLVGELPHALSVYQKRSPVLNAEQISAPILFLQGLDDTVVPPSQCEAISAVLTEQDKPHRVMTFSGEGHGFRLQKTCLDVLRHEQDFYESATVKTS